MVKDDFENIYDDFEKNANTALRIFSETYETNVYPIVRYIEYGSMSFDIREELIKAFPDKNPIWVLNENVDHLDKLLNKISVDINDYDVKELDVKSIICDIGFFDELDNKIFFIIRMFFSYLNTLFGEFLLDLIKSYFENKTSLSPEEVEEEIIKKGRKPYIVIFEYFFNTIGISTRLPTDLVKDDMILFYEIKNSYTHAKGRVNRLTLDKLTDTKYKDKFKIGRLFWINKDNYIDWHNKVVLVAQAIHSSMNDVLFK